MLPKSFAFWSRPTGRRPPDGSDGQQLSSVQVLIVITPATARMRFDSLRRRRDRAAIVVDHPRRGTTLEFTAPCDAFARRRNQCSRRVMTCRRPRADPPSKLLNEHLADAIDLQLQAKQAHWNIKGPNFAGLHDLFDRVAAQAREYADAIAERAVALGGVARGTLQAVSGQSQLREYPLEVGDWRAHVRAMQDALATFGRGARKAIDDATALNDADTADLFTEIRAVWTSPSGWSKRTCRTPQRMRNRSKSGPLRANPRDDNPPEGHGPRTSTTRLGKPASAGNERDAFD